MTPRLASLWRNVVHRDRVERDLDDELQATLDLLVEEKRRAGVAPEDAQRAARLELGIESVKEEVRSARAGAAAETVLKDIRHALRLLRRAPAFTAAAVATLALGIGANTAMFSILDSLVLRPLPVKDPGRLAALTDGHPIERTSWSYPIWEQVRQHADLFDGAFAWSNLDARFDLSDGGESRFVSGMFASASMFETLGLEPALGRTFTPEDDRPGGGAHGPVAVISYAFWQRRFGAAPDVVGRRLTLQRIPFTIVGVAPGGFLGPEVGDSIDVIVPFGVEPILHGGERESWLNLRDTWWLTIMVRLKPGQTVEAATAAVRGVQGAIRAATLPPEWPALDLQQYLTRPFTIAEAPGGRSSLRFQYHRPLVIMLVVVALVLLIACANIANLLLARAAARAHEWGVRLALGASRARHARQLITESLVLAILGASAGVLVARWGSALLIRQLSSEAVTLDLTLDWRVLAFTALVTALTALVFGVAPALRAARGVPGDALREQGRGMAGTGGFNVASGLVVAQVLLSVVLVVAAGLFLRTFSALARVSLGFDSERVLLVNVNMQRAGVPLAARLSTSEQAQHRVLALPGVKSAGLSVIVPTSGMGWSEPIAVSGAVPLSRQGLGRFGSGGGADREQPQEVFMNAITPGWLSTYGTPLIAGRDLTEHDIAGAARVVLVNQAFARKFLDGANPIGHTVRSLGLHPPPPSEIVGVVADAVYTRPRDRVPATMYVPLSQFNETAAVGLPAAVTLSVRAAGISPASLTKSIASAVAEINPHLALTFRPLDAQVSDTLTQERLLAMLSVFFGTLALLMAAIGLYGVTSYTVNLRKTEIGIRMALGATRGRVVRMVLARVSFLVGPGILLGIVISAWASRFVASLLFGIEPQDPVTLASSALALSVVAAIAGWLPARRASRIEPARVFSDI
jgi:predicted permease